MVDINYVNQGLGFLGQKNWDGAIEAFTHAIEQKPDDFRAYINRGRAYQGKGDFALAEKDFNEAVRLDPQNLTPLRELGLFYQRIKKFPEAIEVFNRWPDTASNKAEPYEFRAGIYRDMGDLESSLKEYEKILKFNPNYRENEYILDRDALLFFINNQRRFEELKDQFNEEIEKTRAKLERTIESVKGFDEVYHGLFEIHETRETKLENGVKFWLRVLFGFLFVSVAALIYWVQSKQISSEPFALLPWVLLIGFLVSPLAWYIRYIRDEKHRAEVLKNYYQHKEHLEMRWKVLPEDSIRPMQERLIEYGMEKSPEETLLALNRKGDSGSSPLTPAALVAMMAAIRRGDK